MRVIQANSPKEAYLNLVESLVFHPENQDLYIGGRNRLTMHAYSQVVEIEDPSIEDLSLGLVGFAPGRWARFLTQYAHEETLRAFLETLPNATAAQQQMYYCHTGAKHTMGNCLIGVTVHMGKKPVVTLMSRTTNLVPIGALDLSFGVSIARYIQKYSGKPTRLVWMIPQVQIGDWEMLPTFAHEGWFDRLDKANSRIERAILDAKGMSDRHENPSPKYKFYGRMAEKYRRMVDAVAKGVTKEFVAELPQQYLPGSARLTLGRGRPRLDMGISSPEERKEGYYQLFLGKVLEHYGPRCTCCGESEPLFFTIDPVGAPSRRDNMTITFLRSHVNAGFLPPYEILCANCSTSRRKNGFCPHTPDIHIIRADEDNNDDGPEETVEEIVEVEEETDVDDNDDDEIMVA